MAFYPTRDAARYKGAAATARCPTPEPNLGILDEKRRVLTTLRLRFAGCIFTGCIPMYLAAPDGNNRRTVEHIYSSAGIFLVRRIMCLGSERRTALTAVIRVSDYRVTFELARTYWWGHFTPLVSLAFGDVVCGNYKTNLWPSYKKNVCPVGCLHPRTRGKITTRAMSQSVYKNTWS